MDLVLKEAIRIAKLAGSKIRDLREKEQYSEALKADDELVTSADLIANEMIKSEILKCFPGHHILTEEDRGPRDTSIQHPTWIVDPIDGTVGYANNHYQVAVSIAYAVDNKVKVGVVYNPFLEELFYAEEGSGAFLNGEPIRVKELYNLRECLIGTGFPYKKEDVGVAVAHLADVLPKIRDIRRLGSAALDICWVACGRLQGFYEGTLQPWDIAAARLIAIEAGAEVGHYRVGSDSFLEDCINGENLIVSSPGVFMELQKLLRR